MGLAGVSPAASQTRLEARFNYPQARYLCYVTAW